MQLWGGIVVTVASRLSVTEINHSIKSGHYAKEREWALRCAHLKRRAGSILYMQTSQTHFFDSLSIVVLQAGQYRVDAALRRRRTLSPTPSFSWTRF